MSLQQGKSFEHVHKLYLAKEQSIEGEVFLNMTTP